MAADSSQAGYLRPGTSPPYGDELENIFQAVIVGVTGIPGRMVRPKFQKDPPSQPGFDIDWCAFSVYVEPTIWNAYKTLKPDGSYVVEGTEVLLVTCSFYGPHYQAMELTWRNGVQIGQNLDALYAAGMSFQSFNDPVVVPVLLKEQWVKKADVKGTFHRWASRTYPVLSLTGADGTVTDGIVSVPFTITPSP